MDIEILGFVCPGARRINRDSEIGHLILAVGALNVGEAEDVDLARGIKAEPLRLALDLERCRKSIARHADPDMALPFCDRPGAIIRAGGDKETEENYQREIKNAFHSQIMISI